MSVPATWDSTGNTDMKPGTRKRRPIPIPTRIHLGASRGSRPGAVAVKRHPTPTDADR